MEYIIGILLALLGGLVYERTKRKSAEAILENNEVAKANIELDKTKAKLEGLDQAEEELRRKELERLKEKQDEKLSDKDIIDFFNNRK